MAHHAISFSLGLPNQHKTTMGFSPFQLVHGVEAVTPIECEISSLKIAIHVLPDTTELEERLVHLEHLDE